ncbi:hypothetical protein TNCV_4393331 [Trichonephila clavipes]|nr:hypothetical protein TNCV_4393331 [Trichonephila clavipes]
MPPVTVYDATTPNTRRTVFIESSALEQVVAIHSGMVSLAAKPSQWRYTPQKSCAVVRRRRVIASALHKCLGMGHTVVSVSNAFQGSWFLSSAFFNVCGNNALCSSEGQGDFRLRRLPA